MAQFSLRGFQNLLIFVGSSLLLIMLAAWFALNFGYVPGDALSRTYSAMMVLYSRYPHLAAIGFIWPPLPTLAQLPLVSFLPLTGGGFSGGIVTALAGGAFLAQVNKLLRRVEVKWFWRAGFLFLLAINPLWLLYAVNGMSEMLFLLFFTIATANFMDWQFSRSWRNLVNAGLIIALMVGVRYDGIPYIIIAMLGILLTYLFTRPRAESYEIEAHLLVFLMPAVYVTFLWFFFNWLIMGDALYFLRSVYSNAFLTQSSFQAIGSLNMPQNWLLIPTYFFIHLLTISPLFVALGIIAVGRILWHRDVRLVALLLVILSPALFQLFMFFSGQSFGLFRFYISIQSAGILLALYFLRTAPKQRTHIYWLSALCLPLAAWMSLVAMAPSSRSGFFAPIRPDGYENAAAQFILDGRVNTPYQFSEDADVAQLIRARFTSESALILVDSQSEKVVLYSQLPKRFIVPSDFDYDEILADPAAHADYILVANPTWRNTEFHILHVRFPTLYDKGLSGFVLDSEWGDFRLYRNTKR